MTSEDIYAILASKPHNPHYLKRYVKFIFSCTHQPGEYTEKHHICPKATDLFPEYRSFRQYPWNRVVLTARQHFVAHLLLWNAFGGSQVYAFNAMRNGQKSKYQSDRINSKLYSRVKEEAKTLLSAHNRGNAHYRDKDGNVVTCSTTDPRVLSGELVSLTLGRTFVWTNHSSKDKIKNIVIDRKWKMHPIRKARLYFLDIRIEIQYTRDNFAFLEYIEQGWSLNRTTPEYRSKIAAETNRNRKRKLPRHKT